MHNLMPAELAEIITTHKALFGGWRMQADAPADPPADSAPPTPEAKDGDQPDQPLGEGGLRALQAERDARKQLEAEVAKLKGSTGVLDELRKALAPQGAEPDPQADLAAQVAEMRKQLDDAAAAQARQQLAVEVATAAGVTHAGDVALIAAQTDKGAMEALALRLKGAMPAGTPKPDPSTGHSGDPKPRTMADAINQHYRT